MSTKFKVWIDNPNPGTNIQSYEDFSGDTQRETGFSVGTVASSIRVNSALRQASLVSAAMMEVFAPTSDCDLTSEVDDIVADINLVVSTFAKKSDITEINSKLGTQVTYSLNGTTLSITTK